MKSLILVWLILGTSIISAEVPPQAQASALAVPTDTQIVAAVVIVQCHLAVAVDYIDGSGHLYPQHFGDLTQEQLLLKLNRIPVVQQIDVACPGDQAT